MLKIHFDAFAKPHPICSIEGEGSMNVMLSDISFVIGHIYNGLKQHDPEAAERFKRLLRLGISDETSPVFKDMPMEIFDVMVGSYEVPK